jgi:GTP:adenosylcobinamide-phosphate guanylyltransferase
MASEGLTAVALAGGRLEPDFVAAGHSVANKAYLPLHGVLMLERVLRSLRGAKSIDRIRCVTPRGAFDAAFGARGSTLADEIVAPGDGLIDSLMNGLRGLPSEQRALIVATDIPLAHSENYDAFASRAAGDRWDVSYGYVRREAHVAKYPAVRHTWARLRDGTMCGSGVTVIRAGSMDGLAALLRRITAARKSPLRLAGIFSAALVFRYVFGQLTLASVERRASEVSGLRCRGVDCEYPELAVNVDRLADLGEVERILDEREAT